MTRHMLHALDSLKERVEELGRTVLDSVVDATEAVMSGNLDLANRVIQGDSAIDLEEVEVEEECLKVLALHQPVATDLRLLVGILKLNNDLERIGDLAVSIAGHANSIHLPGDEKLVDLMKRLSRRSQEMLQLGLDCLIRQDGALAERVCAADDDVDELYSIIRSETQSLLMNETRLEPRQIEGLMRFVSVARSLERIADHATNIAEDVIYMVTGEISRHGSLRGLRPWKGKE
ncbi:MAG: phosphate signaling complex protein PhoU [Candidatus Delongbacteria bacterium]|nr:phosphate signaling complex protein PhoU [Candidatus Delongbacteria bacterium]